MNDSLKYSFGELEKAKNSFASMKASKDFMSFENHWRDLLNYIEKCWNKAERECQIHKNKFQPWQGKYKNLRKNDPLLSYIKNARDVDEHSIQEIVDKISGYFTGRLMTPNGVGFVKKVVIGGSGITEYEGDPIIIETYPAKLNLRSIINHGKIYSPPQFHHGKAIKKYRDPIEVAELAINFYEDFLNEISKFFFT